MGHTSKDRRIKGGKVGRCEHTHTVTTFIAGLARTVCETCGKVSIRYLGEGAHWPEDQSGPFEDGDRPTKRERVATPACKRCHRDAYFITPWGLACSDHAWEAASRQDPLAGDFWIPLLIDRSDIQD